MAMKMLMPGKKSSRIEWMIEAHQYNTLQAWAKCEIIFGLKEDPMFL